MLLYCVVPHIQPAGPETPGHPTYVHHDQGARRWENANLYGRSSWRASAERAIGETFAHLSRWSFAMLDFPSIPRSRRDLVAYEMDEEAEPILDLDDPKALFDWAIRPSEVVIRNRPHTQGIARAIFAEGRWSGLGWWSMHRRQ